MQARQKLPTRKLRHDYFGRVLGRRYPHPLTQHPCRTWNAVIARLPLSRWHATDANYLPQSLEGARETTGKRHATRGYWQDVSNLSRELDKAGIILGVEKPEDWQSITLTDLREAGFPHHIRKARLVDLLISKYPEIKWNKDLMLGGRYFQQQTLERAVRTLFPDAEVRVNARNEPELLNPKTDHHLELDLYLPSSRLGFEYQEKHHYTTADYTFMPLAQIKRRDEEKKRLAQRSGITLIVVPFWWDGRLDSLVATIKRAQPDLLPTYSLTPTASPIPEEIPTEHISKLTPEVEGVGQPSAACFFTLSDVNPVNWLMFEKYDGIRGFWNPTTKKFYSRNGRPLAIPQEIIDSMPDRLHLDGEIWFGIDSFQEAMKITHRVDPAQIDWTKFKYMVFDIPNMRDLTYAQRYTLLEEKLGGKQFSHLAIAPSVQCRDMAHFESYYQEIIDKGGEGIILRDPKAPYQLGRCPGYLKHKKFRDAEAKVVEALENVRWKCQLPNGVTFIAPAGTAEFARRWNPQPGDIVSFKHHGYLSASKRPKLPTLYRLRQDLTWDSVVSNWKELKPTRDTTESRLHTKRYKPKGYWNSLDNRKQFFLQFAKDQGFDPYNLYNWRHVTKNSINSHKGNGLIEHFDGSLKTALQQTFEELRSQAWPLLRRP